MQSTFSAMSTGQESVTYDEEEDDDDEGGEGDQFPLPTGGAPSSPR